MPEADLFTMILTTWGGPGAIIIFLGIAYWRKDKQVTDAYKKVETLQNKRVEDVAENVRLMAASTRAMEETADAVKENTRAVQELARRR